MKSGMHSWLAGDMQRTKGHGLGRSAVSIRHSSLLALYREAVIYSGGKCTATRGLFVARAAC